MPIWKGSGPFSFLNFFFGGTGVSSGVERLLADRRGRRLGLGGGRVFHIRSTDGPVGTRAGNGTHVDAQFFGKTTGQRGDADTMTVALGWACRGRRQARAGHGNLLFRNLFLHRGRFCCFKRRGGRRFAFGQDRGQDSAHVYLDAFGDDQPVDNAILPDLNIDLALFRADHGNGLAPGDLVTRFDHPLKQGAGLHVCAQAGHDKVTHGSPCLSPPRRCRAPAGMAASSRCLG